MDTHRAERVSEALREELAEIIGFEMADPRLANVAVSEVHVTPDLRHAHVVVVIRGDDKQRQEAIESLDTARHYLRRELSGRLRMFRVPELHFEQDTGAGGRIEELLERVRKSRKKASEKSGENTP
jgi:ribosome-binding factor A